MIAFPTRFARMAALAAFLAGGAIGAAAAQQQQPSSTPPNALQGFSQNRDQPIKIDSAALEVRDKDKTATFSGGVQLVQGDTTLRCNRMVVFYNTDAKSSTSKEGNSQPSTSKDGGGQQSIRRIEVRGDVIVTQKDQKATADSGFFDMKTNMITLVGNVVISQGQNVVRGDRLSVDMTTSISRVECDKSSQCRVQALLIPGGKDGAPNISSTKDLMKQKPPGPSGL